MCLLNAFLPAPPPGGAVDVDVVDDDSPCGAAWARTEDEEEKRQRRGKAILRASWRRNNALAMSTGVLWLNSTAGALFPPLQVRARSHASVTKSKSRALALGSSLTPPSATSDPQQSPIYKIK